MSKKVKTILSVFLMIMAASIFAGCEFEDDDDDGPVNPVIQYCTLTIKDYPQIGQSKEFKVERDASVPVDYPDSYDDETKDAEGYFKVYFFEKFIDETGAEVTQTAFGFEINKDVTYTAVWKFDYTKIADSIRMVKKGDDIILVKYTGTSNESTEYTIPSYITKIGDYDSDLGHELFRYCSFKKITVPGTVKSIGEEAFYGIKGSVVLSEGIETIGKGAFSHSEITEISIPSTVKSIGEEAFSSCKKLTAFVLPETVETIGDRMLYTCDELAQVEFPASCKFKSIPTSTFANCKKLTSFTIPEGIEEIGGYAFYNSGLTSITVPASVKKLGGNDGGSIFASCENLTSVILNEGLEVIGHHTFNNTKNIAEITIPSTVTKVYGIAFGKWLETSKIILKGIDRDTYREKTAEWNTSVTSSSAKYWWIDDSAAKVYAQDGESEITIRLEE